MRRFRLRRDRDVTGVSGTGIVAIGVEFDDGKCVLHWIVNPARSIVVWDSVDDMMTISGHGGATVLEWIDGVDTWSSLYG